VCDHGKGDRAAVSAVDALVRAPIVDAEYITLAQAARIAGYRSTTTLHRAVRDRAVRENRLRTMTVGPLGTRVTTRAWLDEYLAGLQQNKSHRGRSRSGDTPPEG
jgi:hypothetical protein